MASTWTVRRILCPCDFSDSSKEAVKTAVAMAQRFEAQLDVLHVIEPLLFPVEYGLVTAPPYDLEEQASNNARRELDALLAQEAKGVANARSEVLYGLPWQQILEHGERTGADLIVIGTHGHTGIKHLLLGSTAERVVRHANCPVLTVKPPAKASTTGGATSATPS